MRVLSRSWPYLGLACSAVATAQAPVHAVVTGEEPSLTAAIAARLEATDRYELVTSSPIADCGDRAPCWRAALGERGLDQLVFVERVDATTVGVRVVDADGAIRRATAPVADPGPIEALFFGSGVIHVVGAAPATRVVVDGRVLRADGEIWLREVASGKHAIELSCAGYEPRFVAVMLLPAGSLEVDASLRRSAPAHARVPGVALGAVFVAVGIAAIAASADTIGEARTW